MTQETTEKDICCPEFKTFMWYTTCPKYAKKYGNNYVVFVAEIEKG